MVLFYQTVAEGPGLFIRPDGEQNVLPLDLADAARIRHFVREMETSECLELTCDMSILKPGTKLDMSTTSWP